MAYPYLPVNPCCTDVVLNTPCGCSSITTNGSFNNTCNTNLTASSTIVYNSVPLPCTTIKPCDTLNVAIQKIDNALCSLAPINKIYRAILSQTNNNVPTIVELQNDLGGVPTITVTGIGTFDFILTGAFPTSKTFITVSSSIAKFFTIHNGDSNTIDFVVIDRLGERSPGFSALYLEIIVYN